MSSNNKQGESGDSPFLVHLTCMFRLATNLKKFRSQKGYSLDDVSKQTGIHSSTLHFWENGRPGKVDAVGKLAQFMDVTIDDLMYKDINDLEAHYKSYENMSKNELINKVEYLQSENEKLKQTIKQVKKTLGI